MKISRISNMSCTVLFAFTIATFAQAQTAARNPLGLKEYRTVDGSKNNRLHPQWGIADAPFARLTTPAYGDGVDSPSGADRPSPRLVSNIVCDQTESIPNAYGYTDYLWQWGQFLDHDLSETPTISPSEAFNISVPTGDEWFDPQSTGTKTIPLNRSYYEYPNGYRDQFNELTNYIDASQVYGSDEARARELRTLDGTGKLKVSNGNLLPFNLNGFPNAPSAQLPTFFLAGDIRVNEQLGLIAIHTLFVREHNY